MDGTNPSGSTPKGDEAGDETGGDAQSRDGAATSEHKRLIPVLWLSAIAMLVTPFMSFSAVGRMATSLLVGGTALVALRLSGARRAVIVSGDVVVATLTIASALSREIGQTNDTLTTIGTAMLCALLLITPVVVVVRLTQRPKVNLDTVAGALAAYIQIGLFFATAFRLVDLASSAELFAGVGEPTMMDYQFFSFVTLTTLGYGDLVPAIDVGKSLAMVEAVLGQVFLVTVVAIVVGNLGTEIPRRRAG